MATSAKFVPVINVWVIFLVCSIPFSAPQASFPFRNTSLPWQDRVDDLVGRLTMEEVIVQMSRGGAHENGPAPAIPRLGIPPHQWNTECLRGDPEAGPATAFPQALGLAATFSTEVIHAVAEATSREVRAKYNNYTQHQEYGDHTGISCFSPVINIMRHPLWGRNQETYGEDPYLSGSLAQSFVRGLQGDHPRYIRTNAGCKHFDVHGGPENIPSSRFSFDAKVSERDWHMTFLPQFQKCVEAGTYSIMCSYNSIRGVPACANKELLTDILRDSWGFHGYVVSDEGAVENIMLKHHYTKTFEETAAAAVNAGTNLDLTVSKLTNAYDHISKAVTSGLISNQTLTERVKPLFYTRMRLGVFDPPQMNPYSKLSVTDVVQSADHRELAVEVALKTFVLLKNNDSVLPLTGKVTTLASPDLAPWAFYLFPKLKFHLRGQRFDGDDGVIDVVVGPFADNLGALYGDYAPIPDPKFSSTPLQGLSGLAGKTQHGAGCKGSDPVCEDYDQQDVKMAVEGADLVVVCLGTGMGTGMFACVWMVFSTRDRHVCLCVDGVQHQGQACLPVCGWCSAPGIGMFACVWMVFSTRDRHVCLCVDGVQHQGQGCLPVCGWCSAPGTGVFACVWMVFSTRDRAPGTGMFACVWMALSTKDRCVCLCVDGVQHQRQACLPVCGWCSAPGIGMFACVWMVFSTRDRHVCLCVDGVQHQGQGCLPVCGWCSAPGTGLFVCVWMVFSTRDRGVCVWMMFSTRDRHVCLCVDGVKHQGQVCLPVCGWCSAPGTGLFVCGWCSVPRTGVFACVWMVFSTRDRDVCLCVDGVQHQGQACLPVCGWH
ncbi:hypothetical protein Bbelb_157580 [Branchiostoma belcheri]|nr:hypothetical protein Bbelb_157580 [Branchiostoma belcheri]